MQKLELLLGFRACKCNNKESERTEGKWESMQVAGIPNVICLK